MSRAAGTDALPNLFRFILLYTALYAAFGVASPFLPAFLASRGITPEQLGMLLAAGTLIRLVAGPVAGRLTDRLRAWRAGLAICMLLAALAAVLYLPAQAFVLLFGIALAHAAALAPLAPISDALTLAAASPPGGKRGFEYGWVRGAGSAAFVAGLVLSGHIADRAGLAVIIVLQAGLLVAAAIAAFGVPQLIVPRTPAATARRSEGIATLLRIREFRLLVAVAALVLGSHAMHDSFAVIRWSAAGITPGTASLLWSESVAAEVVVFFLIGPPLLARIGPAGAFMVAAVAGLVRWAAMATSTDVFVLALVQPLHGFTFALLHLAAMRVLAKIVPGELAATAQAVYGTFGVGLANATLVLASGWLYGAFGAPAFWFMGVLCVLALPAAYALRAVRLPEPVRGSDGSGG